MHKSSVAAVMCSILMLIQVEVASATDPEPTPTASTVLQKFNDEGVFVRALALKTDTLKFEPCNLNVPFTQDTYSLYKATKSTTWLGRTLPQTPYDFNENNKTVSLFGTEDEPAWNPVLMILDRDKTLAHAVGFYEADANTNVNNFSPEDWEGASHGCWAYSDPKQRLDCNTHKLKELINTIAKFYFAPKGLERKKEKYNEVRLFNYDSSAVMGFIIEDRQCTTTSDLTCDVKKEQLQRLQQVVDAFWHGPKPTTANPCPAPIGKEKGYGLDVPLSTYAPHYSTISASGLQELPVFRIVYAETKNIEGTDKPTVMLLRYVTSIRPSAPSAAIDLGSLVKGKDL